jgi:hypothetical protein
VESVQVPKPSSETERVVPGKVRYRIRLLSVLGSRLSAHVDGRQRRRRGQRRVQADDRQPITDHAAASLLPPRST